MKLFSQPLEIEALKAICCGDSNVSSGILGSLDEDYFFTDLGREAFARIQYIAREKTTIMSWSELTTDPCISEENRNILKGFSKSEEVKDYKGIIANLDTFRKARLLSEMQESIANKLLQDKIDVDTILSDMSQMFVKAKTGKSIEDCFTHIGKNSNIKDDLKGILTGESIRYFPTGFKQWDSVNAGLPLGKLGVIAATSGGGKSLCINQLALNLASNGISVCIVPLEMSKNDMLHRFLANKTDLDMSQITKAKDLSKDEKQKAYNTFRQFEKKLKENDVSIDLFHPYSDMTMEDVLFSVKPFHYDVVMIDYLGLLGGMDGDNQWKKMMDAARFAKRWAESTESSVLVAAQLNEEQVIRYSKGVREHADLMWGWNAGKLCENKDGEKVIKVESQKGRNQEQLSFYLHVNYKKMEMRDATDEEIQNYEAQSKHSQKTQFNQNLNVKSQSQNSNPGSLDKSLYDDI